jgi:hypothetical protein
MSGLTQGLVDAFFITSIACLFGLSQRPRKKIGHVLEILFFFLVDYRIPDPRPEHPLLRIVPFMGILFLNSGILSWSQLSGIGYLIVVLNTTALAGYFFWLARLSAKRTIDWLREERRNWKLKQFSTATEGLRTSTALMEKQVERLEKYFSAGFPNFPQLHQSGHLEAAIRALSRVLELEGIKGNFEMYRGIYQSRVIHAKELLRGEREYYEVTATIEPLNVSWSQMFERVEKLAAMSQTARKALHAEPNDQNAKWVEPPGTLSELVMTRVQAVS